MANIIYDSTKLKVMQFLDDLSEYAGFDIEFANKLWERMLFHKNVYEEFIYYIENHSLLGKYEIEGYSILECYVWQRNNQVYRLGERGKFEPEGNEETVVLKAFDMMMDLEDDTPATLQRLEDDLGRDKMR